MNKKLLTISSALLISSSSLAFDNIYLRVDGGGSRSFPTKSNFVQYKHKEQNSFVGQIGFGSELKENIRAEFNFMLLPNIKRKGYGGSKIMGFGSAEDSHKVDSFGIMGKLISDFYDFGYGKLNASIGIGAARITDKYNVVLKTNTASAGAYAKSEKINPVISFGLGAGFYLSENVVFDTAYSFIESGKSKPTDLVINNIRYQSENIHLRSHNFMAGIRITF